MFRHRAPENDSADQLIRDIANVDPYMSYFGFDHGHCTFCGADRGEGHEFNADGEEYIHYTPEHCVWVRARRLLGLPTDTGASSRNRLT